MKKQLVWNNKWQPHRIAKRHQKIIDEKKTRIPSNVAAFEIEAYILCIILYLPPIPKYRSILFSQVIFLLNFCICFFIPISHCN